jgi:hypothetical protein
MHTQDNRILFALLQVLTLLSTFIVAAFADEPAVATVSQTFEDNTNDVFVKYIDESLPNNLFKVVQSHSTLVTA